MKTEIEWISVEKRVPDHELAVLISDDGQVVMGRHLNEGYWHSIFGLCNDPIYWAELPMTPEETRTNEASN